jgi:hypothetical protein
VLALAVAVTVGVVATHEHAEESILSAIVINADFERLVKSIKGDLSEKLYLQALLYLVSSSLFFS